MIVLKAKIAPILHHDIPPLLNPYFMDAMEEKIGRQRPITHPVSKHICYNPAKKIYSKLRRTRKRFRCFLYPPDTMRM